MDSEEVFRFLADRQARGKRTVLVTVCAVEGSSMRNPGSVMGVCEDRSFAGSLSGGCIEQAVVAEALDAMKAAVPRVVRFGTGSLFLDIKLPCGGGLDLHFQPLDGSDLAVQCLASTRRREPFTLVLSQSQAICEPGYERPSFDTASRSGVFGFWPAPRLQIVGHGAGVEALARLAVTMGCTVSVLSPDSAIIEALADTVQDAHLLRRTTETELLSGDAWTAFTFLFHDHDWEIDLIAGALAQPHFYIGAMGGRRAHAFRSEALLSKGLSADAIATIRAPIGVFHSSRDPQTLALSTLAQVVRAYQEANFEAALG